ncbi:Crp/Fnr family transcriptional regulator [Bradyrhizobium sp. JYMT SZCCT0428]|uniref:Crp/Fnr family transcriptional regulator n=1 Tax=Bradyrhizobium sp. JYMT SZCCT0428 TaxID=2807673 RepID=UPI001BAB116D|nr:Crp/Fnr family transcriptional regulator [Bradyrhizobium sp. JYMT SZCCT0428]MBR1157101.1 Crp/Fnr family transcriptional regulator [Bradyrhizobium sp. JYMT SZCCT0428]
MADKSNLLLTSLSNGDIALLQNHLRPVQYDPGNVLFEAGESLSLVWFPTTAIISLVVGLSSGQMVESALVGRDGVVGVSAAMNGRTALSRAVVQMAGHALVCDVGVVKSAISRSLTLSSVFIRHKQTLYAQAQQSTACMAADHVEQRLCRWLLRARDLYGQDELFLTQDFLAEMLRVRRTSVSATASVLQKANMIEYSRGKITIVNVQRLRESSCECYAAVKAHYSALHKNKHLGD